MHGGVWGVLEVDGPHHEGKASADHDRDRPFHHHGAAVVNGTRHSAATKIPSASFLTSSRY